MIGLCAFPIVEGMPIPFALSGGSVDYLPEESSDRLVIQVLRDAADGRCPDCDRPSRSVHSRYRRTPADLPCSTSKTSLRLEVRRFYCPNPSCGRRTFAERWPELVEPHGRRTRRLAEVQSRVGIACGRGGARLLTPLRMPASPAKVLRLIKAMPMPEAPPSRHVGVDDWAMRKGRTYGTIIVDLDRHRVIDLLPDRTVATLADWREKRPDIRVVARDRSTEYARGARLGSPLALQVADRWHLLANMRQVVERWLHGAHAGLRRLMPSIGSTPVARGRDRAFSRSASERQAGTENCTRWRAAYDEVRRRRACGETLLGIAHDMGLARATVRKYAAAETFPARFPHGPGASLLDPHVAYLVQRIGEGCENAMALWRELRERGFPGTSRQVHRFVAERRTKPVRSGRKPQGATAVAQETPYKGPVLPTSRQPRHHQLHVEPNPRVRGNVGVREEQTDRRGDTVSDGVAGSIFRLPRADPTSTDSAAA